MILACKASYMKQHDWQIPRMSTKKKICITYSFYSLTTISMRACTNNNTLIKTLNSRIDRNNLINWNCYSWRACEVVVITIRIAIIIIIINE